MKPIASHPLAELFPAMTKIEFMDLVDDIKRSGLQHPVTLHDGRILDGRNRYRACLMSGVQPKFVEYKGGDPMAFVISNNLKRRHLTPSQLAMVGAKLANMPKGNPESKCLNSGISSDCDSGTYRIKQSTAAKTLGISRDSVQKAVQVSKASPALAAKVEAGTITLNAAKKIVHETKIHSDQKDRVGMAIPKKILPLWNRAESEAKSALAMIGKLKSAIKDAHEQNDIIYAETEPHEILGLLKNIGGDMERVVPFTVCTSCMGVISDSCSLCKGRGFISQFSYKTFVPEKTKEVRLRSLAK